MDDAFIEYIDRKISEATRKRDEIKLPPINDDDYMHRLRIWWCYESRRQAYEDALVQYKLKTILKKKPEKPNGLCPIHKNRQLSDSGHCMDCKAFQLGSKKED